MGNRIRIAVAGLGLVVLALTGCSALTQPDAQSAPTSSPSAQTPTATESPAPAAAASIVISVESIQILDGSGAVLSDNDYFEPAADVAATLAEAIGSEPTVSRYPAGGDNPPGIEYAWDGFALRDGEWAVEAPYYSEFFVLLTGATVGNVTVLTSDGVAIGDSISSVGLAHPDHLADGFVSLEWTELPQFPDGYGIDGVPAISVLVLATEGNDVVSRIIAPSRSWGA